MMLTIFYDLSAYLNHHNWFLIHCGNFVVTLYLLVNFVSRPNNLQFKSFTQKCTHSVPLPLFLAIPPLNLQIIQAPPFLAILLYVLIFLEPPPKNGIFL